MTNYQINKAKYSNEWFVKWLKKALGEQRMTQEQLSDMTGIAITSIRYYCSGARSPTFHNLMAIVEAMGKTIEIK